MRFCSIVLYIACLFAPMSSHCVPGSVDNAWGVPKSIFPPWQAGILFDAGTNQPDKTYWIMPKKHPANAENEAILIAYIARVIVEHGGYFCATQIRARAIGGGCATAWTGYQNPSGNYSATCFWLCEPGYHGEGCKSGGTKSVDDCRYTKLSVETLSQGISYQDQTSNVDESQVEDTMRENNYQGFFRFSDPYNRADEQDTILAARSFLENGHGIIASPATVSAFGGGWTRDDYSDYRNGCGYGTTDIGITDRTASYVRKTLCMPGFDGPGCTSTVCRECDSPLEKYNESTRSCTDCIENHVRNADGKCEKCPADSTVVNGACLSCDKTEYIKDGKCKPRKQIAKGVLYSCWPNSTSVLSSNALAFATCVNDKCIDGDVVGCVDGGNHIGKKTCVGGKWGECEQPKTKRR